MGKSLGSSDLSLELVVGSIKVFIQVMFDLCQSVLDGLELPTVCILSIVEAEWRSFLSMV